MSASIVYVRIAAKLGTLCHLRACSQFSFVASERVRPLRAEEIADFIPCSDCLPHERYAWKVQHGREARMSSLGRGVSFGSGPIYKHNLAVAS